MPLSDGAVGAADPSCATPPCADPHGATLLLPAPALCPACALAGPDRCALDACITALPYAYPWDSLIQRLKFQAEPGLASVLAPLMLQTPGAQALLAGADRLLPLPLGPRRLAQRGYNQAHELARRLDARRADPHTLLRTRDTPPQSGLGRAERLANVEGAFAVEPARARDLLGRRVILVDDVMTTGASLQAAAAALRQAGVRAVGALVLARTED